MAENVHYTAYPQYTGPYNTYVPSSRSTNNLTINFSRNPKKYKVGQYSQIIKVDRPTGLYRRMTNDVCIQMLGTNNKAWAYGTERPQSNDNLESFKMEQYLTKRYQEPVQLPQEAIGNSEFNLVAMYEKILGNKMMTRRTKIAVDELTKTSNYDSSHVISVGGNTGSSAAAAYGYWDASLSSNVYIKQTIGDVINLILKDTNGNVELSDLMMIISPEAARKIACSQEIVDYVKGSPDAWKALDGNLGTGPYGLPTTLYGMKIIIEDCVYTDDKKKASSATQATRKWVFPDDKIVICSRPGALEGLSGPNFSTGVFFMYEEMNAERYDSPEHRIARLYATEDYAFNVIAPVSGVVLTDVFTPA